MLVLVVCFGVFVLCLFCLACFLGFVCDYSLLRVSCYVVFAAFGFAVWFCVDCFILFGLWICFVLLVWLVVFVCFGVCLGLVGLVLFLWLR